jgi:hypothetical protein
LKNELTDTKSQLRGILERLEGADDCLEALECSSDDATGLKAKCIENIEKCRSLLKESERVEKKLALKNDAL